MESRNINRTTHKNSECVIAEILQHTCQLKTARNGNRTIHCFPIPRIFKMCPNQPAIEITKVVDIDLKNGEIEMPLDLTSLDTIKGRSWREVVRYDTGQGNEPVAE